MDKKLVLFIGIGLAFIAFLTYSLWPRKSSDGGYNSPGINLFYNIKSSGSVSTNYQPRGVNNELSQGQTSLIGSIDKTNSLLGSTKTVTKKIGIYTFTSGQDVTYTTQNIIKVQKNATQTIDFTPTDYEGYSKKSTTALPFIGTQTPASYKSYKAPTKNSISSQCAAVIAYLENYRADLSKESFEVRLSFVLNKLSMIGGFGNLTITDQVNVSVPIANNLESKIDKLDAVSICQKIYSTYASSNPNLIYQQCLITLNSLFDRKIYVIPTVQFEMEKKIPGFNLIPKDTRLNIATQVANAINNSLINNTPFSAEYYCSMISNILQGILSGTEAFSQCMLVMSSIKSYYDKHSSITNEYIMNALMKIGGFAYIPLNLRNTLVSMTYTDLTNGSSFDPTSLCINLAALLYDALSSTDLFKQCVAIMSEIQKIAPPYDPNSIDEKLQKLSGYAILTTSKKQALITSIRNDLLDGGSFNANLHCFNISSAILDGIGNSSVYQQCVSIMQSILNSYVSSYNSSGFNHSDFKQNVILTKLLGIPSFNSLPSASQSKMIDKTYVELTTYISDGEFNSNAICTDISLAIFDQISSTALYKQCIAVMSEILASGDKSYNFIAAELNKLGGFSLLLQESKSLLINNIITDLNNGGEFNAQRHCFDIVSSIVDNIASSQIYKQCLVIMDDIYAKYGPNPTTYDEMYQYIQTKLSDLTGFTGLATSSKKSIIDPIIDDLRDYGLFNKQIHCINVVSGILSNIISQKNFSDCTDAVKDIISSSKQTDKAYTASKLTQFFVGYNGVLTSKIDALALYTSGDVSSFAGSICTIPPSADGDISISSCTEVITGKVLTRKTEIQNSANKIDLVDGILRLNLQGYNGNESLLGKAIDLVINNNGTPESVCTGNTSQSNDNSGNTDNSTQPNTASDCVSLVSSMLLIDSSQITMSLVTQNLQTLSSFNSIQNPSTRQQLILELYNAIHDKTSLDPTAFCSSIIDSGSSSDPSSSTYTPTYNVEQNVCSQIIARVSTEMMQFFDQQQNQISSNPDPDQQAYISSIRNSAIKRVMDKVDNKNHLLPATSASYAKSLFLSYLLTDTTGSARTLSVINDSSRSIYADRLYSKISFLNELSVSRKKTAVLETERCVNPLRTQSDWSSIMQLIYMQDKGTSSDTSPTTADNVSVGLIKSARKKPYYQNCISSLSSISSSDTASSISTLFGTSISGFSSLPTGSQAEYAKIAFCYKQSCSGSGGDTTGCSDYSFSCTGDGSKIFICDEIVGSIVSNVPNADVQYLTSLGDISYCTPTDSEYSLYSQNQSSTLSSDVLSILNSIVTLKNSLSSATQAEAATIENQIKFEYIKLNVLLHKANYDNVKLGSIQIINLINSSSIAQSTYQSILSSYSIKYGLVDSNGSNISDLSSVSNSNTYNTCKYVCSDVYSSVTANSTLSDGYVSTQLESSINNINGFSFLSASDQTSYKAKLVSYISGGLKSSDTTCLDISKTLFSQSLPPQFSGSISSSLGTTNIASITSSNISLNSIISNTSKQNLTSTLSESDLNLTSFTSSISTSATDANIIKNSIIKKTDFLMAGLSQKSDGEISSMSESSKNQIISDTQAAIGSESLYAISDFDTDGKSRVCKTIVDIWRMMESNGGKEISAELCTGMILNNWSDNACNSLSQDALYNSACSSYGNMRTLTSGSYCNLAKSKFGGSGIDAIKKDRKENKAYYDKLLNPPTNKCKCTTEKIFRLIENKVFSTYDECGGSSDSSYMSKITSIFNNNGYGLAQVGKYNNDVCKVIFTQVNSIITDNTETLNILTSASGNSDYYFFARQVCTQRLRDLYNIINAFRVSYWLDAQYDENGILTKDSEFTKWSSIDASNPLSSLSQCNLETETWN